MELSDFNDWLEVFKIREDEKLLQIKQGGIMSILEKPNESLKQLNNKILVALGRNPYQNSQSDIDKTHAKMRKMAGL